MLAKSRTAQYVELLCQNGYQVAPILHGQMVKTFENIADIMLPDSNFQAAHEMILKNKIEQEDSTPSTGLWKAFDIVCDTAILLILEAA